MSTDGTVTDGPYPETKAVLGGFVILAERALRIGDTVKVDGFEGRITDITTRYTLMRALNGRESIVPNEMMITQRVESATLADPALDDPFAGGHPIHAAGAERLHAADGVAMHDAP